MTTAIPEDILYEISTHVHSDYQFAWKMTCKLFRNHFQDTTTTTTSRIDFIYDDIEYLSWAFEHGYTVNETLYDFASKNGRIDIFEWMKEKEIEPQPHDITYTNNAAEHGHLETVQWLVQNGYKWDIWTCASAALNGHLDILKWLIYNGCPYNKEYILICAQYNGHYHDVIKLLDL